ncbi:secretory subunit [Aphanomyces cochlioides]|nr:secretory subunit [Aphanomyces cochlioides]
MKELRYQDLNKVERSYISVERTTRPATADVDAVLVLPLLAIMRRLCSFDNFDHLSLDITDNWAIELPAGLIDEGESVESTVVHEIKEETGLRVTKFLSVGPPIVNDQGITNGSCRFVVVEVEDDSADGSQQQLEATETIQVFKTPLSSLRATLDAKHAKDGDAIGARLYSFALGQELGL